MSAPIVMLSQDERERVREWWELAADRLVTGPRETSWLSATIMLQMALGYAANSGSRVPPIAYSSATRTGYALRMFVDHLGSPRPLDVSRIDADSVSTLATFPVDDEIGTVDVPDDIADRLLLPLVVLVSDTANQPELFVKVVSVEPQFWTACVEVSVAELHDDLIRCSVIRRARDLGADVIESFLRFGYVLRCLDEAFAINT